MNTQHASLAALSSLHSGGVSACERERVFACTGCTWEGIFFIVLDARAASSSSSCFWVGFLLISKYNGEKEYWWNMVVGGYNYDGIIVVELTADYHEKKSCSRFLLASCVSWANVRKCLKSQTETADEMFHITMRYMSHEHQRNRPLREHEKWRPWWLDKCSICDLPLTFVTTKPCLWLPPPSPQWKRYSDQLKHNQTEGVRDGSLTPENMKSQQSSTCLNLKRHVELRWWSAKNLSV